MCGEEEVSIDWFCPFNTYTHTHTVTQLDLSYFCVPPPGLFSSVIPYVCLHTRVSVHMCESECACEAVLLFFCCPSWLIKSLPIRTTLCLSVLVSTRVSCHTFLSNSSLRRLFKHSALKVLSHVWDLTGSCCPLVLLLIWAWSSETEGSISRTQTRASRRPEPALAEFIQKHLKQNNADSGASASFSRLRGGAEHLHRFWGRQNYISVTPDF